jgi:hypothetical protein
MLTVLAGLDLVGIWELPSGPLTTFLGSLGLAGRTAYVLLLLNLLIAGLMLLIWIPLRFIILDVRRTIDRFGLFESELTVDPGEPYKEAARGVFEERPETAIYCYGHTHRPEVRDLDGRVLLGGDDAFLLVGPGVSDVAQFISKFGRRGLKHRHSRLTGSFVFCV